MKGVVHRPWHILFILFMFLAAFSAVSLRWPRKARAQAPRSSISDCTEIISPGSYIVTNNITATASNVFPVPGYPGKYACILIAADFVTLDLGGFAITADPTSFNPNLHVVGINSTNYTGNPLVDRDGIYVHSGTIANFNYFAIILRGNGHTVEHIRAVKNGNGIDVYSGAGVPNGHRIVGNTAISNSGTGIYVDCPAVVLENAAAGNGANIVTSGCPTGVQNSPAP